MTFFFTNRLLNIDIGLELIWVFFTFKGGRVILTWHLILKNAFSKNNKGYEFWILDLKKLRIVRSILAYFFFFLKISHIGVLGKGGNVAPELFYRYSALPDVFRSSP